MTPGPCFQRLSAGTDTIRQRKETSPIVGEENSGLTRLLLSIKQIKDRP